MHYYKIQLNSITDFDKSHGFFKAFYQKSTSSAYNRALSEYLLSSFLLQVSCSILLKDAFRVPFLKGETVMRKGTITLRSKALSGNGRI